MNWKLETRARLRRATDMRGAAWAAQRTERTLGLILWAGLFATVILISR